jgi:hypothetical protein
MSPTLTSLPGDLTLPIDGQLLNLRFSMRTLHNYTTATSTKLTDLGEALTDDLYGAVGGLLAAAVRCATGKPYTTDQALGLLETLAEADQKAVTEAVLAAIRIDKSPVFQALMSTTSQLTATNGDNTAASPSVS